MRQIAVRASRGFWYNGAHVAKDELIIVPAPEARKLQQEGKGEMILTRYPGLLDRGPVVYDGRFAHQDGQTYAQPEEQAPGWYRKDENCSDCPKKAGRKVAEEKPKKTRRKKKT